MSFFNPGQNTDKGPIHDSNAVDRHNRVFYFLPVKIYFIMLSRFS